MCPEYVRLYLTCKSRRPNLIPILDSSLSSSVMIVYFDELITFGYTNSSISPPFMNSNLRTYSQKVRKLKCSSCLEIGFLIYTLITLVLG